jgi:hypothetical protein
MHARAIAIKVLPSSTKVRMLRHRRQLIDALVALRVRTGRLGPLPSFLIIGFGKCGTTELYDRLLEHPNIHPSLRKEVNYFMYRFDKSTDWYRAHFAAPPAGSSSEQFVVGEASPGYVLNPFAPQRVKDTIPDVKIIVLLRNPVDRAYSHYHHRRRLGGEPLDTFEAALAAEPDRLRGEKERVFADPGYYKFGWYTESYVTQGIYADFLPPWLDLFAKQQLLVVQSEDFFRDTEATLRNITSFIGLPDWAPEPQRQHKQFSYPKMRADTRARLQEIFAPHNERLFELLGADFGWNTPRGASSTQPVAAVPATAASDH